MHHTRALDTAETASAGHGIGFPRLYDFLILLLTRGQDRKYRGDLIELASITAGQKVLDIGCGTGTQAIAAWRRLQPGGSVIGVDLSEKMIAAARRKARRAGVSIDFRQADASDLPFPDASFDVVTITTVLHMVPAARRQFCLREAARVLKSGGELLAVDYGGDLDQRHHLSAKHGRHGQFDLYRLRQSMVAEGFDGIEGGPLGWLSLHFLRGRRA